MKFSGRDAEGHLLPEYGRTDYAFVAEVMGGTNQESPDARIRVRVIESWTERAAPGQELEIESYHMAGAGCEKRWEVPIRLSDYPVGSKVRFISGSLRFPAWQRDFRLVLQ